MKLDRSFFDEIHDRSNTGSVKYDEHPAGYAEVRLLPMWIADMDFRTVPEVCEAVAQTASQGIFGYTHTDDVYDQAVVGWYGRRMGWNVDTRWMVKTPGVMFGIAAAIRALTKPGDGVMICQPVYHPFANVISANNRKPVISELRLARGRYEMDFWDIARKIENRKVKLLVLCSPHNPVGRVWTEAELRELGRICIKYGVYLVSDEIHGDFVYVGHRHIPVASLSEELAEITITCTSPSKTFNLAGLQAANLFISDAGIRKKVQKACLATGYGHLNAMAIAAARAAYLHGEPWFNALLGYLQKNMELLRNAFSENAEGISLIEPEGTYLMWLDCRRLGLTDRELDRLFMEKAGLLLNSGFIFGEGGRGFMRMNSACPQAVLEQAIDQLRKTLHERGKNMGSRDQMRDLLQS